MGKRNRFQYLPKPGFFEQTAFVLLLFQIVSTALYFNGFFTNPLVHKYVLGQYTTIAAWFFYLVHCVRERRLTIAVSSYYLPGACLLLWAGLRSVSAPNANAMHNYCVFASIVMAFPLWVTYFRKKHYRLQFLFIVMFAGVCLAVGCLRQLFLEQPRFDLPFFKALTLTSGSYERQRLGAFLGHNNASSAYLLIAAITAGCLWYHFRKNLWAGLFGLYIVTALVLIFLAGSRGVAIGAFVAAGFVTLAFLVRRFSHHAKPVSDRFIRNKKAWVTWGLASLFFVLILVSALISSPVVQERGANLAKRFLTSKQELLTGTYPRVWWMSVLMAKDHPLTGVGFSAWPHQYPYYQEKWFTANPRTSIGLPPIGTHTQRAHNDYLQLWAELGLPGLFLLVWLMGIHIKTILQLLQTRSVSMFGVFAVAATLAAMTRSLFGFPFHEAAASCVFLGNLALLSSVVKSGEWTWQPAGSLLTSGNARYASIAGLTVVFLLMVHPVCRFIMGDFSNRSYTLCFDYAEKEYAAGRMDTETYYYWVEEGRRRLGLAVKRTPFVGTLQYKAGEDLYVQVASTATGSVHPLVENKPTPGFRKQLALDAIAHYEKSKQSYSFYETFAHIARLYRMLWENTLEERYYESAIQNFEKATSIMPTFEEGWMQIALLKAKKGEEYPIARITEDRFPGYTVRTLLPMASQAEKNGDGLTTTLLYEIAAVAKPDSPEVFLSATDFFYRIHRLDLVENALVGLADLQPQDVIKPAINRLFFDLIQTRQVPRAFELSKKLMEKASLNDQPDVWFYCGFVSWVAGQPCDTLYCWTKSQQYGIPKEQLEPAFSQVSRLFFAHVLSL